MLKAITVSNLRSFREPTRFEIAPITVFIGQNSAGKSSITRLFPLMKQSVEQLGASTVLWNSLYVDYGSIEEVISHDADEKNLTFTFELDPQTISLYISRQRTGRIQPLPAFESVSYQVVLARAPKGRTRVVSSQIVIDRDIISFLYGNNGKMTGVTINDLPISELRSDIKFEAQTRPLIQRVDFGDFSRSYISPSEEHPFVRALGELLAEPLGYLPKAKIFARLGRELFYDPAQDFKSHLESLLNSYDSERRFRLDQIDDAIIEQARLLVVARTIPLIVDSIFYSLNADARLSKYVGPIRASAERYYRIQELTIDSIDPRGENLAMYLHFLSPAHLRGFNEIFFDAFGYVIEPSADRGHVSLLLKEQKKSGGENIADVGFGFSQVLPVVAQVYSALAQQDIAVRRGTAGLVSTNPIVAIEQPELHLHPAYQARLGDLFSSLVYKDTGNRGFRFVIETHSEAFVNRLGELISQGKLAPEKAIIYTFEKDAQSHNTIVKELKFNPDGTIENWPSGFFTTF